MENIKYLDSFGIKFHFYTNNQPNYQNVFGGIMTLIYVLICIGIFFIFSYEDINRLNPISAKSEITDIEPRNINIRKEKIWLPFRIVTDENKYIDHRGFLYLFPYLVEGKYKENYGMELKYHLLNYKLCNETSMANKPNNYKIDVPLNELFCIDQDDITFGGNWNGKFINFIEMNLYLCEEEIYFNLSDPRCAKAKTLFNNINSSISFDFYYPVVQFQPSNFQIPISIIYKNYFYRLSAYSHKLEKIYIQEHLLSDDINIITSNYKNTSCWGVSSLYGDDYYSTGEDDPIIRDSISQIFTMDIYMDFGLIYYTRTYNKIFVIISNIFPIFRLVLYFFKEFTQHIKISLTKRNLAGLIFEKKNISKISILKIENNDNLINKAKISPKIDDSQNELIRNKNVFTIKNNNNLNNNNLNKNNNNNINIISLRKNGAKKTLEKTSDKKLNILSLNDKIVNKEDSIKSIDNSKKNSLVYNESLKIKDLSSSIINSIKKKSTKKNVLFSYYYFFLDMIFDKLINPQKFFCISKTSFTVYNFMGQIYDISTHIILFKQFNIINNILKAIYEEKGFSPDHHFKKININDTEVIEKINKDLKNKKSLLFSKNLL